jgi:hypothetical protein
MWGTIAGMSDSKATGSPPVISVGVFVSGRPGATELEGSEAPLSRETRTAVVARLATTSRATKTAGPIPIRLRPEVTVLIPALIVASSGRSGQP